jgi:hypothetical protein
LGLALLRRLRGALRAGPVDTSDLPRRTRTLVTLGYLGVFALLAATLAFELFGDAMPRFVRSSDPQRPESWPLPILVAAAVGMLLGWALVLTGATDCGRRAFLGLTAYVALMAPFVGRFLPADALRALLFTMVGLLVVGPAPAARRLLAGADLAGAPAVDTDPPDVRLPAGLRPPDRADRRANLAMTSFTPACSRIGRKTTPRWARRSTPGCEKLHSGLLSGRCMLGLRRNRSP